MRCECADPGCPTHSGISNCSKRAVIHLKRVDMHDETGELFCEPCADDAMESGVFTTNCEEN